MQTRSIRLAPSVRSAFSPDGAVLMEITNGMMYTSNPVGGRILELLARGVSLDETVSTISAECNAPRALVLRDVQAFTEELRGYGLIEKQIAPED